MIVMDGNQTDFLNFNSPCPTNPPQDPSPSVAACVKMELGQPPSYRKIMSIADVEQHID